MMMMSAAALFAAALLAVLPPPQDYAGRFGERLQSAPSIRALSPRLLSVLLGGDAQAIFRFVRDEIRFEPYRGALRGGHGTLAAGAGNSYDQAILLKEMLDATGARSRLARCRLPENLVELLTASVRPAPRAEEGPLALEDLAWLGIAPERWSEAWARFEEREAVLTGAVLEAAASELGGIEKAPTAGRFAEAVEAAGDYLWVQLAAGDRWVDLHPCLPAETEVALSPRAVINYLSSMPTELFHWVRLRLFAERLEGRRLTTTLVLERRVPCVAAANGTVALTTRLSRGPAGSARLTPSVRVGSLRMPGSPLDLPSSDGSATDGALTALRLEIGILSPGRRPRLATLTLADALTAATRRSLAEATEQVAPLPTLSDGELWITLEMILATGSADGRPIAAHWAEVLRWIERALAAGPHPEALQARLEGFPHANPLLLHWATLLQTAWSLALPGKTVYLDSPAVAAVLYRPVVSAQRLRLETMAGVVFMRAVTAPDGDDDQRPARTGEIASRLLRRLALAHSIGGETVTTSLPERPPERYAAVAGAELPPGLGEGWSPETLAELERELMRGATVLVSEGGPPELWWSLEDEETDPVARGPLGWQLRWENEAFPSDCAAVASGELLRALAGACGSDDEGAEGGGEMPPSDAAAGLIRYLGRHLTAPGASQALPVLEAAPGAPLERLLPRLEQEAGEQDLPGERL